MKLHIESDAFASTRFHDFQEEGELDRASAVGILVYLWQESQSRALVQASKEEILGCIIVPRSKREKVFENLLSVGYLKPTRSADLFEIRGNRKHVEALENFREMGRKGGLKSGQKRRADDSPPDVKEQARKEYTTALRKGQLVKPKNCSKCGKAGEIHGHHSDYTKPLNVTWLCQLCHKLEHDNIAEHRTKIEASAEKVEAHGSKIEPVPISSDQFSSDHLSSDPKEDPLTKKDRGTKNSSGVKNRPPLAAAEVAPNQTEINRLAWNTYTAAYRKRYGVDPTRNQTVNAQMANFVRRVGGADAPGIAAFYVTHNDFTYVKSQHPIGLLLRDAEGLRTQWLKNKTMTSADAREVEKTDRIRSQIERIDAGEVV